MFPSEIKHYNSELIDFCQFFQEKNYFSTHWTLCHLKFSRSQINFQNPSAIGDSLLLEIVFIFYFK